MLFFCICFSVAEDPEDDDWWNKSWEYRKLIEINSSLVDSDLTSFPVLISISSDVDLASHAQKDSDDIVFILYNDQSQDNAIKSKQSRKHNRYMG